MPSVFLARPGRGPARALATAAALLVGAPCALAGGAPAPELVGLGFLPDGTADNWSRAAGVSADGSTVLCDGFGSLGTGVFRWTRAGGMTRVPPPPGEPSLGSFTAVGAISNDGSSIVGSWSTSQAIGRSVAFRWRADTGTVLLGTLPEEPVPYRVDHSSAYAVSGNGSVVMGSLSTRTYSFRWTQETGIQEFPLEFHAMTPDARVLVGIGTEPVRFRQAPYRWTQAGGRVLLPVPEGSSGIDWVRVSDDGATVVGTGGVFGLLGRRAWRWAGGGAPQLLPMPAGATDPWAALEAVAVSADGSVIAGIAHFNQGSIDDRAMLWTETLGTVDLNGYLPTLGIDLSGWVLRGVSDMTPDGRTLVGWGTHHGRTEAWLVTIPAPGGLTTAALLAAGLAPRRSRRRR